MTGNNAVQTYVLYDGPGPPVCLNGGSGSDWRFTGELQDSKMADRLSRRQARRSIMRA